MQTIDVRRRETEALVEAIWGPAAVEAAREPDPVARHRQNAALAHALRAYLQLYVDEAPEPEAVGRGAAPAV